MRIINKDRTSLHTITENIPPVYVRGQGGLLDVVIDPKFASNHRIETEMQTARFSAAC
jgi:glucose/arabinose dehydrogenase